MQRIIPFDLFCLSCFAAFFYFIYLGGHPLLTPDEGRYAEVSREMLANRNFITPYLNGVVLLDKPIFHFWLQSASIYFFGLKEWALRIWPAILGILGCLLTYLYGIYYYNRRTAILAALILLTSPLYFGLSHYANLDAEISFFITACLMFFSLGLTCSGKQKTYYLYLAYASSALAMLTKGLIGVVLPSAIILTWLLLTKKLYLLKQVKLLSGITIFSLIAFPWYILVQWHNPQFFAHFFLFEQASRFLSQKSFSHTYGVWFYLPVVLIGFLPWSLFLIQAIKMKIQAVLQKSERDLYLLVWMSWIFIFFSIPQSKTISYIMPAFPPMALFVANYFDKHWLKTRFYSFLQFSYLIPRLLILTIIILSILNISIKSFVPNSIKDVALSIKPAIKKKDEVVIYNKYYQDLPVYLERQITIVREWEDAAIHQKDGWPRELWFGLQYTPAAHAWLINKKIFWKRWNSEKKLFVFVSKQDYPLLVADTSTPVYKLAESSNHQIIVVSNHQ